MKTTVGKACCSGRSNAQLTGCPSFGLVLQHPHSSPCCCIRCSAYFTWGQEQGTHTGGGSGLLRASNNHTKSPNGIITFHKKEGYFLYWETPRQVPCNPEEKLNSQESKEMLPITTKTKTFSSEFPLISETDFPETRANQIYVHCTPLTPGFLWLCKLQGERTYIFPTEALSSMTYTKHSPSYAVSRPVISTSEARRFISDFLSVTYMFCRDFAAKGPSHKSPKGQERCTAICIAEAQGPVTLSCRWSLS